MWTKRAATDLGPLLYLPVEISARELDSKLLIAHFAIELGLEVIIGQKWLMRRNLDSMPPGLILFKTLTRRDAKAMRRARALGYRIASIDEEVPGLVTRHDGLRWVYPGAVEQCDVIFALGEEHRDTLLWRFAEHREKFEISGNPRWDLLRPEFVGFHDEEVSEIRREFAPFVLINTNLGLTNAGKGSADQMVRRLQRGGKIDRDRPSDERLIADTLHLERSSMDGLKALLPCLPQRFPGHRTILRPHPSENGQTWETIVADIPRTQVVRRGSAVAWILASDVLVHTYCTTGVEAFALGKPAVSFRPAYAPILEKFLSPRINFNAESVHDVLGEVASILERNGSSFDYPAAFRTEFERFFAAQSGAFAAERIARSVADRLAARRDTDSVRPLWRPKRGYLGHIAMSTHNAGLMPDIDAAAIANRLHRLGLQLGRTSEFQVEPCGDRTFLIHRRPERGIVEPISVKPSRLPTWMRRLAAGVRPV